MDSPSPELSPIPAHEPALQHETAFMGRYGLRAGWSLLIYVAMVGVVVVPVMLLQHAAKAQHAAPVQAPPTAAKPGSIAITALGEGLAFVFFLILSLIMAAIEKRRPGVYGLGGSRPLPRFLNGGVWGLVAMSVLIALMRACHVLVFDAQLDHGVAILGYGAAILGAFVLVGLMEEYMFRGYIQFTLTRGLEGLGEKLSPAHARAASFWLAAVITSALFFYAHTTNSGETKFGLLAVFLAGLLFTVSLWRTGSLWWGVGFHAAWDWAQSFLFGVPDSGTFIQGRLFAAHASGNPLLSGGTAGPEGSLFVIPVLALMIVVLFTLVSPGPQPPLETTQQPPRETAQPI